MTDITWRTGRDGQAPVSNKDPVHLSSMSITRLACRAWRGFVPNFVVIPTVDNHANGLSLAD